MFFCSSETYMVCLAFYYEMQRAKRYGFGSDMYLFLTFVFRQGLRWYEQFRRVCTFMMLFSANMVFLIP